MFTGIIEEIGRVKKISLAGKSGSLEIGAKKVLEGTKIGDSIAVNGVCLTVTSLSSSTFTADIMAETVRRSSLGSISSGSGVNLERAMAADGRFGGHIVSGHIDGTGKIARLQKEENAVWVHISAGKEILALIVEKGSIAIDGISLTVASVSDSEFAVSIIPHTASETTLLSKKAGDIVNLENDIVGKYVQKLLSNPAGGNNQNKSRNDDKFLSWLSED
ncbi:MAG: riboflavin synthase [Treponema sp.]|uniref:riboflavin synthase n=1 Tax=Treponema sp. TaxID=166 RepID=UPI0025FC647A|nr:riboflavin synthase [Treponema sp.]MBR0099805.1 riboflavin synthase [Treponema sp.]MBR0496726.1 riboflavin synthase [Treponema sp.]